MLATNPSYRTDKAHIAAVSKLAYYNDAVWFAVRAVAAKYVWSNGWQYASIVWANGWSNVCTKRLKQTFGGGQKLMYLIYIILVYR